MAKDEMTRRGTSVGFGTAGDGVGSADGDRALPGEDLGSVHSALGSSIGPQDLKPFTLAGESEPGLPGVHAYAQKSVAPGDTLAFRISSTVSSELSIVRLGWDTDTPARDWTVAQLGTQPAGRQQIRPGSYIHVQNALHTETLYTQMTLECWVRPWRHRWQGLISQYTYPNTCGFGLFLDDGGRPVAYFSNSGPFISQRLVASMAIPALALGQWSQVAAVFSSGTVRIYINGQQVLDVTPAGMPSAVLPAVAPLRLGAYGEDGLTDYTLDGDIAMPVIHSVALSAGAVNGRFMNPTAVTTDVHGCWPLVEEQGTTVADVGPHVRPGTIVNRGTWMIGGPKYVSPATGPNASLTYNPMTDDNRGNGLRLSSDDLYDCGWSPSATYTVPSDLPPGVYAGRFEYFLDSDGICGIPATTQRRYDAVFIVRRASSKPVARILVLCNSNTWLAYNAPFPNCPDVKDGWGLGGPPVSVAGAPSFNVYNNHTSGAPAYQVGTKVPWSVFPYMQYNGASDKYSHLLRAERYMHVWLEQNGYEYDVATDFDVHQNPGLLTSYKVVMISGHSEYWSAQAYNGLKQYLASGGGVFVASGNTMFWRVSYDAAGEVMECRKLESRSTTSGEMGGRPGATIGELFHSHDRSRGGLMREAGHPAFGAGLPAWRAIGLESVGFGPPGAGGTYKVSDSAHEFFTSPEPLGVVGNSDLGIGTALHEWDVRVSTMPGTFPADVTIEPGATPVQLAQAAALSGDQRCDYYCNLHYTGGIKSEMIDWQRPGGGRVFAAGGVAVPSKLASEGKLGALARNVIHHLGVKQRVDVFAIDSAGRARMRRWNGASWLPAGSAWDDTLGGQFQATLQAVQWAPNHVSILGVSSAGQLLYRHWDGTAWHPSAGFTTYAATITGRPTAVGLGRNLLFIYARGTDGIIAAKWWDGANWGPSTTTWQPMGPTAMESDPSAAVFQGRCIGLAALGTNHRLYYIAWNGTSWSPAGSWTDMGGDFTFAPTLLGWGGNRLNVFAVNRVGGSMMTKHFDGTGWDPDWSDLGGTHASRPVAVARRANELSIFAVGSDGRMKGKWFDGTNWGPSQTGWTDLGGSFTGDPAAVSWRGNHVIVMGVSAGGAIQYKRTDGSNWFPSLTTFDTITGGVVGARPSPTLLSFIGS